MSCNTTARIRPNDWLTDVNNGGNTTLTFTQPNTLMKLAIGGSARTSLIILSRVRRRKGDIASISVTLPAVAGIVLDFKNGADDGASLLPVERYDSQQFTTDGATLSAEFVFYYDGDAWKYLSSQTPA